jgi:cell division protein FtsN
MEVVVDEPTESVTNKPSVKPTTTDSDTFMIQVGSFKKMNDADAFKARLALLGIESKVQTVTIDNKETWHRVQVGPILGRDKADSVQKTLKENGFKALLLRTKNG